MKNMTLLLSGSLLFLACATAQAADCATLPRQDNSEAAVRKLDTDWSRAYYTGDSAFLECLYAPNFHSADSSGMLDNRDHDIVGSRKYIGKKRAPSQHKHQPTILPTILMFPHSAVVTWLYRDGTHGTRITDFYEYDGRRWHATFSQDTKF